MKLKNLRKVKRCKLKENGITKEVNLHQGRAENGFDIYFYYFRSKKVLVTPANIIW